jgi:hypothetical protein
MSFRINLYKSMGMTLIKKSLHMIRAAVRGTGSARAFAIRSI